MTFDQSIREELLVIKAAAESTAAQCATLLHRIDAAPSPASVTHPPSDAMLDEEDVALRVGLKVKTLRNKRVYGGGPPYFKLGRSVRYRRADLDAWISQNRRTSTSSRGGRK